MIDLARHRNVRACIVLGAVVAVVWLLPKVISFIERRNQVRNARDLLTMSWAMFPGVPNRLGGNSQFGQRVSALSVLVANEGDLSINDVTHNLGAADATFPMPDGTQFDYWCKAADRRWTASVLAHVDGSVSFIGFVDDDWPQATQPSWVPTVQPSSAPITQPG